METSPTSASTSKNRIDLLDGWRTLAVLLMVVWHLLYDLHQQDIGSIVPTYYPWRLIRCGAVHSFLFLAGVSCHLSKNNFRRGKKLCLCALCVNVVMVFIDPVVFGILHLMALCTLLWAWRKPEPRVWKGLLCLAAFAALYPWLPNVRVDFDALFWLGLRSEAFYSADYYPLLPWGLLCLAVFAALYPWLPDVRVDFDALFWLGLRSEEFYSADYYPLLPWSLLFFAGGHLGPRLCEKLRGVSLPSWCTWVGRHALLIYAVHQPILLAGIWIWERVRR